MHRRSFQSRLRQDCLAIPVILTAIMASSGVALAFEAGPAADPGAGASDGLGTVDTSSWRRRDNVNTSQEARKPARAARRSVRQRRRGQRRPRRVAQVPRLFSDELLADFPANTSDQVIEQVANAFNLVLAALHDSALLDGRIAKFSVRSARRQTVLQQLENDNRVRSAQPNYVYSTAATRGSQYAFGKLKLDLAHKISHGDGISVVVIDSGVRKDHPAFAGHSVVQFDALGEETKFRDSHGTAISSIIAARDGIVGVAPNVQLLSARTFAYSRSYRRALGETFHLLRSLDWAIEKDAKVLNLSFTGPRDPLVHAALKQSVSRGAVAIGAAGNKGRRAPPAFPAAYGEVIAVTATDERNRLYRRSNRGDYIHLAAPGVNILSASGGSGFRFRSGTSMAAAHVSGAVALLLQNDPTLTPADVASQLAASAQDLGKSGRDRKFGFGLLDVLRAVNKAPTSQ